MRRARRSWPRRRISFPGARGPRTWSACGAGASRSASSRTRSPRTTCPPSMAAIRVIAGDYCEPASISIEYQRFGNRPPHHKASRSNALHAKTIVVDRRLAWIGSFNLDPRSSRLNTEMAVLLAVRHRSPQISARRMNATSRPTAAGGLSCGQARANCAGTATRRPPAVARTNRTQPWQRPGARSRGTSLHREAPAGMLVRFSTRFGQLLMLGEPAVALLKLGGHSGTVPSAVLAADLPAFLQRLRQGLEAHGDELSPPPPLHAIRRRMMPTSRVNGRSACACAQFPCWTCWPRPSIAAAT